MELPYFRVRAHCRDQDRGLGGLLRPVYRCIMLLVLLPILNPPIHPQYAGFTMLLFLFRHCMRL